jgi:beta-phosphoglucomutase
MAGIKACIFDLDGVIVDTAIYHYKAWKRLANELGFDFSEEDNEKLKGVSRIKSLELILEWGGISGSSVDIEEFATRKNAWYVEMINEMKPDEILPGAQKLLQDLRLAGIKTALGSASKNSKLILKKTRLLHLFDAVVDGNTVTASKPDPEVFLKGAKILNVPPGACIVFEDAISGIAAARAAGMKVVGVGSSTILKNTDLVISGLDEMSVEWLHEL